MAAQSSTVGHEGIQNLKPAYEIYLRWATRTDIPGITKVLHTNLLTFEFFDHFAPRRGEKTDEFYAFVLKRVRMFFVQPGFRFMVAEKLDLDVLGGQRAEIVGFSTWEAQGDENWLAQQWQSQQAGVFQELERRLVAVELLHYQYLRNSVLDYESFAQARHSLHESYHNVDSLRSNLHLQYLMVDPAWQRGHRVGHRLLQWGLDVADQLGLPIVLESSLVGHPFYARHGFKVLQMVRIDVDPTKAYDMPVLLYEPKGKEGSFLPQAAL